MNNKKLMLEETLFFTGNGYIGIRGNFEEGYKNDYDSIRGTYINGFYETVDVVYGEDAFGFPKTSEKIVNVIDAQSIIIYLDGEEFSLFSGEIIKLDRKLDIENGCSIRNIEWISPKGHHMLIEIKRMTSFEFLELFTIDYKITSLNFIGEVKIMSSVCGDVSNYSNDKDPRVASGHTKLLKVEDIMCEDNIITMTAYTNTSNMKVATTTSHSVKMKLEKSNDLVLAFYSKNILIGETINFTKYVVYTDNYRHVDYIGEGLKILKEVQLIGINKLYNMQRDYLNIFWKYSKIEIKDQSIIEDSINYNTYQLLASAGRDGKSNVSAKGLSGEGYEGHYFWDTEIYVLPFFTLTNPKIAENLMKFRHFTLDGARKRALDLGHLKGVKIPWRTISGKECSTYFPAGTAQYHINSDVAYSIIQNYLFSNNINMMIDFGFELLIETARLLSDAGHFYKGEFRIDAVTGPDEYTAVVNNNYYTNKMAKYHMYYIGVIANKIKEYDVKWHGLKSKLELTDIELEEFKKISENMYLPIDNDLNISLQDDSFMAKKEWDIKNTPKDKFPLLLYYHPLTIYRHKVLKQADVVLAHFLLDDETDEIMSNSYSYYENYTTHDSSLSPCVYSMMAARLQDEEKAYDYFMKTLRLDLDNLHHNTKDGLHIANAGGTYMSIVYGFAGFRIKENGIHIKPILPKSWHQYSFSLNYLGALVTITIGNSIKIRCDKAVVIYIDNVKHTIKGEFEL